jgi:hypothetical protein
MFGTHIDLRLTVGYNATMPKEHLSREAWLQKIQRHYVPRSELQEILDGVLLSDGHLRRVGERSTAYLNMMQSPVRRGWLELVQKNLAQFGVITKIDSCWRAPTALEGRPLPGGQYDLLRSLNYVELVGERDRWYSGGVKVVPRDLSITPVVLLHWFCGDGRGGDRKGTLGFCTDGFSVEDVDFLVGRLQIDLGVTALRTLNQRGHPQILISQRDEAMKVRSYIEEIIPDCCQYKLRYTRARQVTGKGRKVSLDLRQKILVDRGTCTMREAASRHGVSVSKVWSIWHSVA